LKIQSKRNSKSILSILLNSSRELVEFAPQHSTRQIINSSEFPLDQIVTSATSHTNILPAVYFAVKARYDKYT
jgi:hypothetical protein